MIRYLNKRLEETTCFSKSQLWSYIQSFYIEQGLNAWNEKIPYLVTNSHITAYHHAKRVLTHAKGPYTIIDYGAGVGQHGYYLAKHLTELAPHYQKPIEWFTILLADISQKSHDSWLKNPDLAPYIKSNLIVPFTLSGKWINDLKNIPPQSQHCLIANYLFDSMPFMAYDGEHPIGLALYTKHQFSKNPTLEQLILKPSRLNESKHPYPHLIQRYGNQRYTIPHLAISFIQAYFQNTQDALMIINDKMFLTPDDIDYDSLFNLTLEGCYSSTLNMDAILQTTQLESHITNHCQRLQTVVLSHHAIPQEQSLNCSDVASLFEYYKTIENIPARFSFSIAKSFSYEPFCLEIFSQSITPDNTSSEKLMSLIHQCQAYSFHNSHPLLLLHASKILRRCLYFELADQLLETFLTQNGPHPAYYLEKGILYFSWKKIKQATHYLKQALKDHRTQKTAQQLLDEII